MTGGKHFSRLLVIATFAVACLFLIPPSGMAEPICGDADCSGFVDIGDLTAFADYMLVNGGTLGCPENLEFDGYHLVTMRDYLMFIDGMSQGLPPCGQTVPTPFVPPMNPNIYLVINTDTYPAMATSAYVTVDIVTPVPIRLLDLPLAIRVNGAIPFSVDSLTGTGCKWIASDGVVQCFRNGNPAIPAGTTRLFSLYVQANPQIDPVPITYSYIAQPPTQDAQQVRSALAILPGATYDTYEPLITIASSCCIGMVGNVDCDQYDGVDVQDLTAMIDYLFITGSPLCCKAEANCDLIGDVDVGDLTELIGYLFIYFHPMANCP